MSSNFIIDEFEKCLNYKDCSIELMDKLYSNLPSSFFSKPFEMKNNKKETVKEKKSFFISSTSNSDNTQPIIENKYYPFTLKSYIQGCQYKEDIYTDWPGVLTYVKGSYKINMNVLNWFFNKGEKLDAEDIENLLDKSSNRLSVNQIKTIVNHSDSKPSSILHSVCNATNSNDKIISTIKNYINNGVKPTEKTFFECLNNTNSHLYTRFDVDEKLELYKILKSYSTK